ncbi:MAG: PAS domain-containing protein, partial [Ignavibacteriae bacterium]|nr:PAS domain-containing protein [Ignavibacteriota bacterium]
ISEYKRYEFIINPNLWKEIVHPDDYKNSKNLLNNFIQNKDENIQIEYRIISKSGAINWVRNKIRKIENEDGTLNNILGIVENISSTIIQRDELKKKIDELQKLNKTKDKFISIISHDLKSPFTSIVGFTELALTDSTLSADEMREYMGHIKDASMHTLDLVNSLLDWTRLQTGRLAIKPVTVNANYLVRKTTEILKGFAAQKGIELIVDIDESIFVQADEGILTQVFNNLVSNSLKFTPKDGAISILAKRLEDQQKVEFTVKDTGVGIDEEDIKKLFVVEEKFTTLGTEGERGTGLGLSLVKEIIEKHNGKIYVKSVVGEGTEFIFTIPISTPAILVIDDKQTERIIYSKLVEGFTEGITIYTATDFEKAKMIIKEKMPMLVISESKINDVKASEFYKSIRETQAKYKPSYFILTRHISEEEKANCRKAGIDEIQLKPIEIKLLKKILDELVLGIEQ